MFYFFSQKIFQKMEYYKVPFMDVLPLVSRRSVYLENGFAYVPRNQLATLVQGAFRTKLSKGKLQQKTKNNNK